MEFFDPNCGYKLLGVYHVHRKLRVVATKPRNYISFSYRIRGSSIFTWEDQQLQADSGSVVFLPEEVSFRNQNQGDEEILVVHMQSLGQRPTELQVYPNNQALEPLFRQLLTYWEAGNYARCMSLLYQIFEGLRQAEPSYCDIPAVIAPGVRLMRERFRDPTMSIAQAADLCFISQVYFRRIYRQHFGTSPMQDVLQWRFDHALGLLRSGYYSTEEISRLSGFSDAKYFRTAFTKRYGCTPRRWLTTEPQAL
jgi:AraC-like DNA-binding protein